MFPFIGAGGGEAIIFVSHQWVSFFKASPESTSESSISANVFEIYIFLIYLFAIIAEEK